MIETLGLLGHGFLDCLTLMNIFCAVIGCLLGSLIGVLSGLGISGTVAILLPVTFGMQPPSALIITSGIYLGSQYGGAITSILVSIPGETTSVMVCFNEHLLIKQEKGGRALSMAAISSLCGGTIGLIGLAFVASTLARVTLSPGKVEFFVIVVFGPVPLTTMSGENQLKGPIAVCLGVILGRAGLDDLYGTLWFTYGVVSLYEGINFVTFIMGAHGITELMSATCTPENQGEVVNFSLRGQFPNKKDFGQIYKTIGKCDIMGFGMGLVPRVGSTLATFSAYGMERSLNKHPDAFGTRLSEGVAAPETANNATMYAGMVPLLNLDIPFISSMVLSMSAFIVHGITLGLMFISGHPNLFWGLIASMLIGDIALLTINLPLIGIWASLLRVDFTILTPLTTFIMFAGGYAINNSAFDMEVMMICGTFGFLLSACGYNMAALAVELFPSPVLESSFLGTMTLYKGNLLAALMDRPIAAAIPSIAMAALAYSTAKSLIQSSEEQKAANQGEV